jgi:hypothetical protein
MATRRRVEIASTRRASAATQPSIQLAAAANAELWRGEGLGTRNGRVLPKDASAKFMVAVLDGRQPYQKAKTPLLSAYHTAADHDCVSSCHRSCRDP